ncbi:MAG TPA: class I SAM-dependent methyltransferase [Actinomycetota bacterium]|jgi:SAM-dependent methyltransferase
MDEDYRPATYGDRIAEVYDEWYTAGPGAGGADDAVAFLSELAGGGPALELGIGTGRIALPLRASGVTVHGIDASTAMVEKLVAKGGDSIPVTIGSFADFELEERFSLVYVVFNTFFALLSQDEQVACFRSVERHLGDGGVFVMEAFVPDLTRYHHDQNVSAAHVGADVVKLDVSVHDAVAQRATTQHVVIREGDLRLYPVQVRYAYVSELDLMARLVGMRVRERWAGWRREPFGAGAQRHVSVWERAPAR